jgi:hypothetical protein
MIKMSLVVLGLLVGAGVWTVRPDGQVPPQGPKELVRWEYKVVDGKQLMRHNPEKLGGDWEGALAQLGDEGWELAAIVATQGSHSVPDQEYWFKRPK